jgi:CubicO group peptidase (beta-lactamase class C family)
MSSVAGSVEALDAALEIADTLPRLHSLLISQDGELLVEQYFNGRDASSIANVKSASKSVISALVGVATREGFIAGVQQPIGDFFGDRLSGAENRNKNNITVGDLLTMQSGLETTSNRNYGAWVQSRDWVGFALEQPLERPPGTLMEYSTGNTHLLSAILTIATGDSTLAYARHALGEPLGFHLAQWPRDPLGIYFGGNDMEFTPRQMLAFGELYLNGGLADGRQVVPTEWVDASLQARAVSTRESGRYYGYGWWLREMAGYMTPYAWGYGGQFIVLVPELNLVVVTTSSSLPSEERRPHLRQLYDLFEFQIVAPLSEARDSPAVTHVP